MTNSWSAAATTPSSITVSFSKKNWKNERFERRRKTRQAYDTHLLRRLLRYMRPYRWQVVAPFRSPCCSPLEFVSPKCFKSPSITSSCRLRHDDSVLRRGFDAPGWIMAAYSVALFSGFGLQYVQVRVMQKVGQETMCDMRKEIFDHLQRLPMSYFDRTPVGRLVTRATTDVDALNDLFASGLVAMVNDFVLLFGMADRCHVFIRSSAWPRFRRCPSCSC